MLPKYVKRVVKQQKGASSPELRPQGSCHQLSFLGDVGGLGLEGPLGGLCTRCVADLRCHGSVLQHAGCGVVISRGGADIDAEQDGAPPMQQVSEDVGDLRRIMITRPSRCTRLERRLLLDDELAGLGGTSIHTQCDGAGLRERTLVQC